MDFKLNEWVEITSSTDWSARTSHRVIAANGYLYLLGGSSSGSASSEVWRSSDGISWSLLTAAPGWSARAAFGILFYNNKLWVFGGYDGVSDFNDVWSSSDGITWAEETSSAAWGVRHEMGYCVHGGIMYISGGYRTSTDYYYSDVWSSSDGITWSLVTSNFGQAMRQQAMISFLGNLWIYGGNYASSTNFSDIRQSTDDGVNWSIVGSTGFQRKDLKAIVNDTLDQLAILGGRTQVSVYNDAYVTTDGINLTSIPQISPRPSRAGTDYAFFNNNVHMFGGQTSGTDYNDVWKEKYAITYYSNYYGTTPPTDSNNYDPEDIATILGSGSMSWFGHEFNSWNTSLDGSGTTYNPGDSHEVIDSLNLYAQWDLLPMVLYVEAVGSNTFPFDTRAKAATSFFNLWDAMPDGQLYEGWTVYAFGSIVESYEWGWWEGDGAIIIGEDPQTTVVDVNTNTFETVSLYNISFTTNNVDAEWNTLVYDPVEVNNCKFNGNNLWGEAVEFYNTGKNIIVIGCTFENCIWAPLWIIDNNLTATNDVLIINNSFDSITTPVELYINLYNCTIGRFHFYNNVAKETIFEIYLSSITILEFLHDHNFSTEGYDYTEDSNPFSPDATETTEDPLYLGVDSNNMLEIDDSSPAYHTGINRITSPSTDIRGNTFFNPPSRGAYEVPSQILIADLSGTPTKGESILTVQFTDISVGTPTTWYWDFGDGETSTEQNPTHDYILPGSYNVSLRVSDGSSINTKVIYQFVLVTGTSTYDVAPDPNIEMPKLGEGSVLLGNVGIEIYSPPMLGENDTGFYRSNGPSLIFD